MCVKREFLLNLCINYFCDVFSDSMETDDKAGSSPAGKAADVVLMITFIILYNLYYAWVIYYGLLCLTGEILYDDVLHFNNAKKLIF